MDSIVQIKGIRDGLLISLGEGSWQEVHDALLDHLNDQAEFLQGGRIALDVGKRELRAVDLGKLRDSLSDYGLNLWAILSTSPTTRKTAQTLGLATRISKPHPDRAARSLDTTRLDGEQAILVQRTLRSGFRLQHPGHVTVVGDVNPGAEIIAGGNVLVWGRLRGMVHAGATGDETAIVCALDLSPTQLRIADQIAIPSEAQGQPQPEIAFLKDGQVVAEPWHMRGR